MVKIPMDFLQPMKSRKLILLPNDISLFMAYKVCLFSFTFLMGYTMGEKENHRPFFLEVFGLIFGLNFKHWRWILEA